jgi:ParB family chromosome partitioning protein
MTERELSVHLIDPPATPARLDHDVEELNQLADSIKAHGLINAITVKPDGERYQIIAGHQRWLAHKLAGLERIRCTIRGDVTDQFADKLRVHENLQRNDLSPIEEALELRRLRDADHLTIDQVGLIVRRRPDWVEMRLKLLELPDDLGPLVHSRRLAIGAALALARCTDDHHRQYLTQYALNDGASVTTVAAWIESWRLTAARDPNDASIAPPLIAPGGQPIVLLPCAVCEHMLDHKQLLLVRLCPTCCENIHAPNLPPPDPKE